MTWLGALASTLFLPRFLGESDFGLFSGVGAFVSICGIVAGFGMASHVVKHVARDPSAARGLLLHVLLLRSGIWTMLFLAISAWLIATGASGIVRAVLWITMVAGLAGLATDTFVAGLQGNQTLGRVSLVGGLGGVAIQAMLVTTVILGGGVTSVSVVGLAGVVAITLLSGRLAWSTLEGTVLLSWSSVRTLLGAGRSYLAWDLGQRLYSTVDLVILAGIAGAASVGEYAFADRIVSIPAFGCTIVGAAVYAALASASKNDPDWFSEVLSNGAKVAFLLSTPAALGLAALAPNVTALVTGGKFGPSSVLIIVLAVHIPAAALHTVLGTGLTAADRQGRMAKVAWAAGGLTIAGNAIAIPLADSWWDNPAIGAAVITVMIEAFMGAFVWTGAWPLMRPDNRRKLLSSVCRILVAACASAGIARLLAHDTNLFVAVGVGAAVYVVAVWALRIVSRDEIRSVWAAARR
jgi:O-antigen/teichoic acid export membrane protein